jgi:hypothetical protein
MADISLRLSAGRFDRPKVMAYSYLGPIPRARDEFLRGVGSPSSIVVIFARRVLAERC